MMINLLLILLYTLLFSGILYWYCKRKSALLTFPQAASAFVAKVIFGCLYGWFFLHFYGGDDTWYYHTESLKEYALLKTDALSFFKKDIVESGYTDNPLLTVFNSNDSFFKDLQHNLLIKMLAIFNIFSGGRYYVNVVFFNALIFCGSYYLFALVSKYYPSKRNLWFLFIFFFPPLLFWTSGIRKDGLCFIFLSGCLYQTSLFISASKKLKHAIAVLLFWAGLFLVRNFLALSLLPVITAWVMSSKFSETKSYKIYMVVFVIFIAAFFLTSLLPASFNLPQKIADRQHSFSELKGNSVLNIKLLDGTFLSYASVLPQAVDHSFLRPYPQQVKEGFLYLLSFLENILVWGLLIYACIKPAADYKKWLRHPFTLALLSLAIVNYVAIGYMVPFIGAIIRYKILFEALLLIVLLQLSNLEFKFLDKYLENKSQGLQK